MTYEAYKDYAQYNYGLEKYIVIRGYLVILEESERSIPKNSLAID